MNVHRTVSCIAHLKTTYCSRRLLSATVITRKLDSLSDNDPPVEQDVAPMEQRLANLEGRLNRALIELQELRERSLASQERIQRIKMLKRPEYQQLQGLFDKSLPWPAPLIRRSEAIKRQGKYASDRSNPATDEDTTLKLVENSVNSGTTTSRDEHALTRDNDDNTDDITLNGNNDELLVEMNGAINNGTGHNDSIEKLSEEDINVVLRPKYASSNPELDALLDNVLSTSVPNYQAAYRSRPKATAHLQESTTLENQKELESSSLRLSGKLREKQNIMKRLQSRNNQQTTGSNKYKL